MKLNELNELLSALQGLDPMFVIAFMLYVCLLRERS